jgi:hypothetical protein
MKHVSSEVIVLDAFTDMQEIKIWGDGKIKFQRTTEANKDIFSNPESRARVYQKRMAMIEDRIYSSKHFERPKLGSKSSNFIFNSLVNDKGQMIVSKIGSLVGST